MDLVIHIGFGKCGSSALQSWLSHQDILESADGQRYVYCAVTGKGDVIWSDKLRWKARLAPAKYVSSASKLYELQDVARLGDQFRTLKQKGLTPIISHESWARNQRLFREASFFEKIGVPARVFAYVRPHVDWLNSAWWQWLRWSGNYSSPDDFWSKHSGHVLWANCLNHWAKIPNVSLLDVRLLDEDIVGDFCGRLGIDRTACRTGSFTRNAGIGPSFLKLYEAFPVLQPKPTNSFVDTAVKNFSNQRRSSPWVISPDLVGRIIAAAQEDNKRLLTFLDAESQNRMKSDPKWWDASAYANKSLWQDQDGPLTTGDMAEILAAVMTAPARYLRSLFD